MKYGSKYEGEEDIKAVPESETKLRKKDTEIWRKDERDLEGKGMKSGRIRRVRSPGFGHYAEMSSTLYFELRRNEKFEALDSWYGIMEFRPRNRDTGDSST